MVLLHQMSANEANIRHLIDKGLRNSGWKFLSESENPNVITEFPTDSGTADYVLKDSKGYPLAVIEAKREMKSPLDGKEQGRKYSKSLNCRFVFLSNGYKHYQWDTQQGNPYLIKSFPNQQQLEMHLNSFNPTREEEEDVDNDYLALTQFKDYKNNPDYNNDETKEEFIKKNKLRFLRDYQLKAVLAVKKKLQEGNNRFLLEMATGTGKTNTATAIIKMFLRLYNVKRVLFLVDRLELETQGKKEINDILGNDYQTVIWKENRNDWIKAHIVVSTVQSFISRNKYKRIFKPDDFDLVISDEAHRSLGERSRSVFEYFIGFKLGLTATPRDFLKSVDTDLLTAENPKELEKRMMLDTYTIFGCEDGQPTFRYSLAEGVKDGYLINPTVVEVDTGISAELMSKEGIIFKGIDEEGNDVEDHLFKKDFEKKFKSEETNISFCRAFMDNAQRDPYTNEIGKTLIFCVSQKHAGKITQILNDIGDKMYPNRYQSDFAVQVTSSVEDSQQMTINFKNNSLNGHSPFNEFYRTSKSRVCVTVGMMTTGYDCTDLLNICLMRPVFSPSEFIQMKGRGTRLCDFAVYWISQDERNEILEPKKRTFKLFDYFKNYQYFEEDFDYDEKLKLPAEKGTGVGGNPPVIEIHNENEDPITGMNEIQIAQQGMKIDIELYKSLQKDLTQDEFLKDLVNKQKFDEAIKYFEEKYLNQSTNNYSIDKMRISLGLDRKPTSLEILLHAFGHIDYIKSKKDLIEEEFEKFDNEFHPSEDQFDNSRYIFETLLIDKRFRDILESGALPQLSDHPSYEIYINLSKELKDAIPAFIKSKVNLEMFSDA